MKPIKVRLIARTDDSTGELGLQLEGLQAGGNEEVNSATDGLLIAHDIIEHVNGVHAIGTIDDELEALGAIWYVRGQHGDLSRNGAGAAYSVEANIAADVSSMFRDYVFGQPCDTKRRYTRPCEADAAIDEILRCAEKDWRAEFEHESQESRDVARSWWRGYKAAARHRMRAGYRKAYRRWEHRGQFAANNAFWEIAEAIEPYCKNPDEGMQYELTYSLTYSRENGAHVREIYGEDY